MKIVHRILQILWKYCACKRVTPGVSDATPALLVAVLMFALPATEEGGPLLTWPLVQARLAWGVIILLGGGFALAEGAKRSCLSAWVASSLASLAFLPPGLLRLLVCGLVSAVTQVSCDWSSRGELSSDWSRRRWPPTWRRPRCCCRCCCSCPPSSASTRCTSASPPPSCPASPSCSQSPPRPTRSSTGEL